MKVLLVNDCPIGLAGSGGVEEHVQQLQEALHDHRIETAVLTHQYSSQPELIADGSRAFIHNLNAPLLRKHPINNFQDQREALVKTRSFMRKFKPDVVHVHNMMNPIVLRFLRHHGPVVKSIHDCRPFCGKPWPAAASRLIGDSETFCDITLGSRCFPRCYALAGNTPTDRCAAWASYPANLWALHQIRKVDHLVLYSHYLEDLAARKVPETHRLHVVYHFTAAEKASAAIVKQKQNGPFTFLFAGRLAPEKGILHIFDALKQLPDVNCRLVIAGDGPLKKIVYDKAAASHPNHQIEIHGFLARDQLYKLYRNADALLFTSVGSEGCPLTGIEAMYFALPVIGFDAGGVEEWLVDERTGILLERKDINGLAAAMRQLAGDRNAAQQLGLRAREYVSRKFRRDQHVQQLLEVYQQAIGDRTRRKPAR